MAKAIKKETLYCSDCDTDIYRCYSCGKYLFNGQEIICQEIHYCISCGKNNKRGLNNNEVE